MTVREFSENIFALCEEIGIEKTKSAFESAIKFYEAIEAIKSKKKEGN
jgi:hypothetical protein